jgi:hypothetical protein
VFEQVTILNLDLTWFFFKIWIFFYFNLFFNIFISCIKKILLLYIFFLKKNLLTPKILLFLDIKMSFPY